MDIASATESVGRFGQTEIKLFDRMTPGFQELREILASVEFKLNTLNDTLDKLTRHNRRNE